MQVTISVNSNVFETKDNFKKFQKEVTRQVILAMMASAYRKYEKDDAFCVNALMLEDCIDNGIIGPDDKEDLERLNRSLNIDNILAV